MKCPNCKKEMTKIVNGFNQETKTQICNNKLCIYMGIERIVFDEIKDDKVRLF